MGLTELFAEDRMSLSDALKELESIVEAAGEPEATTARVSSEPKECMVCLENPREVRFGCGHACCCLSCLDDLKASAAAKNEPVLCLTCREPIDEQASESGAHVANAPTFCLQNNQAAWRVCARKLCRPVESWISWVSPRPSGDFVCD